MLCPHCRRNVLSFAPRALTHPEVGDLLGQEWAVHVQECPVTCSHCERSKEARRATCGAKSCASAEKLRVIGDRIADVQILLVRTTDPDWIAREVGLSTGSQLREWLRKHGRRDLVTGDGPLAPERGVAA